MRTVLLTLLVLSLALPAPAAVYRCRNAKGILVLTDDPENFPPGCRPEGRQGSTAHPSGSALPPGAASPSGSPSDPRSAGDRRTSGPPARQPNDLPAGSSGAPPELNRPDPFRTPPPDATGRPNPQGGPGLSPQEDPGPVISVGPVFEGWLEEARALNREYLESQTGPPRPAGSIDPRHEIEKRIDAFLSRLDSSPLSPQERGVVERELPSPAR